MTDKIVYISLVAAVDSKFDWEKIGKGALEQLTAIYMAKESSREQQLCYLKLFDNACTLKQDTSATRLCVPIKSGSGSTRLHDELDLQLVSIYKPQIFSYGT